MKYTINHLTGCWKENRTALSRVARCPVARDKAFWRGGTLILEPEASRADRDGWGPQQQPTMRTLKCRGRRRHSWELAAFPNRVPGTPSLCSRYPQTSHLAGFHRALFGKWPAEPTLRTFSSARAPDKPRPRGPGPTGR